MLNKHWIALHLSEAVEELQKTLAQLSDSDFSDLHFERAMTHAYNHLNTAWNSRYERPEHVANQTDEEFHRWRAFPTSIDLAR